MTRQIRDAGHDRPGATPRGSGEKGGGDALSVLRRG